MNRQRLIKALLGVFLVAGAFAVKAESADIIIYGSSPAAIAAAVQAKRMGVSAVIVSPETRLGGLTTGGLGSTDIGNKAAFGGIARDFYRAVKAYYDDPAHWTRQRREDYRHTEDGQTAQCGDAMWTFEPSAALSVLEGWVRRDGLVVRRGERLDRGAGGVSRKDGRIVSFRTEKGTVFEGRMFLDCTYEGDLLAAAGVSFVVGREANAAYDETISGVECREAVWHQLRGGIDPYVRKGDRSSGLLPGVEPYDPNEKDGDGDRRVQAYCFRMCLTDDQENRIPFKKPDGYSELDYEILFRNYEQGAADEGVPWINSAMPNRKTDTNNRTGFSTDFVGRNYRWPEASYAERDEILAAHLKYQQGLMWTLANHPRVPAHIRAEVSRWGTCRDEFADGLGDGWQRQLYVREARRLVGEFVMTEHHCRGDARAPHPVALGAYGMDSHNVRRHVGADGFVHNEGDVEDYCRYGLWGRKRHLRRTPAKDHFGFDERFPPYGIDYGALVPRRGECANLLVPVCISATHMAFGSIRMEPVFFALGQVAATAAAQAIAADVAVQDVPYPELRRRLVADGQVLAWGDTAWPLVTVRHTGTINETPKLYQALLDVHRHHPGSCDEYWLCSSCDAAYRSDMSNFDDEMAADIRRLGDFARAAARDGIAPGFQQGVTLGHGGWSAAARKLLPPDAWQRGKKGEDLGLLCPRSPAVHRFEYEHVRRLLAQAPFASYWLDDDLRMGISKSSGCFCDRCIQAFNSYAGVKLTREQLVGRLFGSAAREPLRAKWSAFNGESIALFAAAARRAADEVNADCRLGYQSVWSDTIETAIDYRPLLKALSGGEGRSVGIRPGAGCYDERNPLGFLAKAMSVAREAERCRTYGFVGTVCYEQETYPRRVLQKSPGAIVAECTLALASGCDSVSLYWYAGSNPEPVADYERFAAAIAAARPEWEKLSAVVKATHLGGLARYVGSAAAECPGFDLRDGYDVELAGWGIPVTVSEAKPQAWLMTAKSFAECDESDWLRLASGGVVVDAETFRSFVKAHGAAARKLVADPETLLNRFDAALAQGDFVSLAADGVETVRPYPAEYDVPRKRLQAACVVASSKGGGRLALVSRHENRLTRAPTALQRRAWLDACDAVASRTFPVRAELCHPMRILPRVDARGDVKAVTILNCSMGETGDFDLTVRNPAKRMSVKSIPPWTARTVYP